MRGRCYFFRFNFFIFFIVFCLSARARVWGGGGEGEGSLFGWLVDWLVGWFLAKHQKQKHIRVSRFSVHGLNFVFCFLFGVLFCCYSLSHLSSKRCEHVLIM